MKLKVYTQNCFGIPLPLTSTRHKKIAAKISEISPDVVFLQEIQWKRHVSIFEIPGYRLFHEPGVYATMGGLLTLIKEPISGEAKFIKFTKQGGVRQIADRGLKKGMLDVFLDNNVHLINTHFLSTYSRGFKEDPAQLSQLDELLAYVKPFGKFIGAGDLNFTEGSLYYEKLVSGVSDLSNGLGYSHVMINSKLDFVFGGGISKVLKKEYVEFDKFVSDHKGIYVETEI